MSDRPTIERCWLLFRDGRLRIDVDPVREDELKQAFYCGFTSGLQAVEIMAVILERDGPDESEVAWQTLEAEYEKFAAEHDNGDLSTHH